MGTWDTSLYGGDLPLDIKDEYYEQLYEGHTCLLYTSPSPRDS